LVANLWFEQEFNYAGDDYHVVFIQKQTVDNKGERIGINGVFIPIDAVTFKKSLFGEWELFIDILPALKGLNGDSLLLRSRYVSLLSAGFCC
jgi:hypothetical protein